LSTSLAISTVFSQNFDNGDVRFAVVVFVVVFKGVLPFFGGMTRRRVFADSGGGH